MTRSKRTIEHLKNVIILALAALACVLLCVYWGGLSLRKLPFLRKTIDTPIETPDAPKTQEVIVPDRMFVMRGGERFDLIPEEGAWTTCVNELIEFSKVSESSAEERTQEEFESRKENDCLCIDFGYGLPFDGFCKQFGIASSNYGNIEAVTSLVYDSGASDSIFVVNEGQGKYYQLIGVTERTTAFRNLIAEAHTQTIDLQSKSVAKELERGENQERIDEFAKTFFGNSFDFIRRVEDSKGTLTFMYGYSEKVLSVTKEGVAEYREELRAASVTQGFYASLGAAIQYAAAHGGWYPECTEDGEAAAVVPILVKAETVTQEHRTGYRFAFAFRHKGQWVSDDAEANLVCDVFDGQVIYYYRNMFRQASYQTLPERQ